MFLDCAYYSVELLIYMRKIPLAMFAVVTYIFPSTEICAHNCKFKLVNWLIEAHNSCAPNLDFAVETELFTDSNCP